MIASRHRPIKPGLCCATAVCPRPANGTATARTTSRTCIADAAAPEAHKETGDEGEHHPSPCAAAGCKARDHGMRRVFGIFGERGAKYRTAQHRHADSWRGDQ